MSKKLMNFINNYDVMSYPEDLLVEICISKFYKPKTIYELGCASGNWCAAINKFAKLYQSNFFLVDNFALAKNIKDLNVPKNITELEQHLSKFDINATVIDNNIDCLSKPDREIDLVRLDCDTQNHKKLVDWILTNGSKNLIILADDILPNKRFDRFLMFQEQVALGKLKLLWCGIESAAWCRAEVDTTNFLSEYILELEKDIPYVKVIDEGYEFFGKKQTYLTTRSKKPYQVS